ncbi:MAG: hypothetical protein A2152_02965 [Candidatus Levybacteria bacterium RBG_16_35_6]|nr:MAG: hypothetical protein A2152_02965 [Candidatus Levybacteria bacterium RBG_16_35_6]
MGINNLETETRVLNHPASEKSRGTIDLKRFAEAHTAGAKSQWPWVENFLSHHLQVSGFGQLTESERIELKYFQNGLVFLVNARNIELDEFMAKPLDPIINTNQLSGLVSGLNLNGNDGAMKYLTKIDEAFIEWAKEYRLGAIISASIAKKEVPPISENLKKAISKYPQK